MEVNMSSIECIKPSTPTPQHLKTHKISLLDQFMPSTYVDVLLFYPADQQNSSRVNIEQRSILLKQSLSETLSRFYPLAGKIIDRLSIDCNDEGVYYVETRVAGCNLLDFMSDQLDNALIQKFLSCNATPSPNESLAGAHVAFVQANMFGCGGVVISIFLNHMIADGVGFSSFLRCWGDIARGSSGFSPDFVSSPSLFPQNESFPRTLSLPQLCLPFFKIGKVVTKRFLFDASALSKLKVEATNVLVPNPTRVEVVLALVWKCVMKALRERSGIQRPSLLTLPVNLRRTTKLPAFSHDTNTMGNAVGVVIPAFHPKADQDDAELYQLVLEIREAKKQLEGFVLENIQGDKGFLNYLEGLKKMAGVFGSPRISREGADLIGFTSWIGIGLPEVDFGWGKPAWVTSAGFNHKEAAPMLNFIILNEIKWGNRIEALVSLDEHDMAALERNYQLLEYSS